MIFFKKTIFLIALLLTCTISVRVAGQGSYQNDCEGLDLVTLGDIVSPCPTSDWRLVFEDNFDGQEVDEGTWLKKYANPGHPSVHTLFNNGKHGGEFMHEDNAKVRDGKLVLIANKRKTTYEGTWEYEGNFDNNGTEDDHHIGDPFEFEFNYRGGVVFSKEGWKADKELKIEAMIKLTEGEGLAPSFWCWNGQENDSDEVDIFETFNTGEHDNFYSSIHNWNTDPHEYCTEEREISGTPDGWHKWTLIATPYHIRIFLDDIEKVVYPRFKQDLAIWQNICETQDFLPLQLRTEVWKAFPTPDNWFHLYFTHHVKREQADKEQAPDYSEMQIDYVRVYQKKFCETAQDLVVNKNMSIWVSDVYDNITVTNGARLTIEGAQLEFIPTGKIVVDKGATLRIRKGAVLTSVCDEQWQGVVGKGGNIIVDNGTIEKARTGINGETQTSFLSGRITLDTATIQKCDIGLKTVIGYNSTKVSISTFRDNIRGMQFEISKGIEIDNTVFIDNEEESIYSNGSSLSLLEGNTFDGGKAGVLFMNFEPSTKSLNIGRKGGEPNIFTNISRVAVEAGSGSSVMITDSRFTRNSTAGIFAGNSHLIIENNNITFCSDGFILADTGNSFNEINCNLFEEQVNFDVGFVWNNMRTTFEGNWHNNNVGAATNYLFWEASINNNIGDFGEPAGNCFSTFVPDFAFIGTNFPFRYHWFDDDFPDSCYEPNDNPNIVKFPEKDENDICAGKIGNVLPKNPEEVCSTCIVDNIRYWTDQLVAIGGDDPRTYIDEAIATPSEVYETERQLENWIHYGIEISARQNSSALASQILEPLKKWKWHINYLGSEMANRNYTSAANILQALPQNTENEIILRRTQEIGLKVLKLMYRDNTDEEISQEDIDELYDYSTLQLESAGHARSLYKLITGIYLPYALPDLDNLDDSIELRDTENRTTEDMISIFPIPASDKIIISAKADISDVQIYDTLGKLMVNLNGQTTNTLDLDVSNFKAGIYFVKSTLHSSAHYTNSIVVK